jgi:hypothetical protein
MPPKDYSHVIGHRFPGGSTVVPDWLNHLWGDAVAAEDDSAPFVHPVLVYYAAVQGAGITFQDIFDVMEASGDSGIMVGEQRFEFTRPLEIGKEYEVEGGITDVVRKEGRRAGVFDIATFELLIREPGGTEPLAASTTSFVFPRREVTA